MDCKVWPEPTIVARYRRIEYVTMKLAEKVGITVPATRLEKVLDQDVYLIERFDAGFQMIRVTVASPLSRD